MARYVDADQMIKNLTKLCHSISKDNSCRACPLFSTEDDMCMVEDFIHSQPDAEDVVKVVRCKDCKYCDSFPNDSDATMPLKCLGIRYGGVNPDWFCEHGERREEDAEIH